MEITGRVTNNAIVKPVKGSDKQVVEFSVAINHTYRSKGEPAKRVTFVECDYWFNTGIAPFLTKGTIVRVYGNPEITAYINKQGFAVGVLRLHTQDIELISGSTKPVANEAYSDDAHALAESTAGTAGAVPEAVAAGSDENPDDLPF